MFDENYSLDEKTKMNLIMQSAKHVRRTDDRALDEFNVMREVNDIRYYLNKASLPSKVFETIPIVCFVKDYDYEETTKRYVVKFVSVSSGEPEEMRTVRAVGSLRDVLGEILEEAVGRKCVVFKYMEESSKANGRSYRTALDIRVIE